jgi:hypothetical protein
MNRAILRVQNHEGRGPYAGYGGFSFHADHCEDFIGHPSPVLDRGIGRRINSRERCGFLNADQLSAWFTAENILEMCSAGFRIEEIENAEVTAIGAKQILFIQEN